MVARYSLNKDNQLTLKVSPKKRPKVLPGELKIDRNNNLIYLVNRPSGWRKDLNIPSRIRLKGKWRLDASHNLVLEVAKQKKSATTRFVLDVDIVKPQKHSLTFRVRTKPSRGRTKISLLTLRGSWRQDKFNRLVFDVGHRPSAGSLTFKNTWKLDRHQQIIYTYRKLKTKRKHTIRFEGSWRLTAKNRLGYILEGKAARTKYRTKPSASETDLNFRVHLQTPTIYPQEGKIKYRLGIGARKKGRNQTLILYGTWKLSRKVGLGFAMDYGKGRVEEMGFSFRLNLTKQDRIAIELKTRQEEPLGITLIFTRKFLAKKAFEYFIRMKLSGKEPRFDLGTTLKF
jgi:hypothetical protein